MYFSCIRTRAISSLELKTKANSNKHRTKDRPKPPSEVKRVSRHIFQSFWSFFQQVSGNGTSLAEKKVRERERDGCFCCYLHTLSGKSTWLMTILCESISNSARSFANRDRTVESVLVSPPSSQCFISRPFLVSELRSENVRV